MRQGISILRKQIATRYFFAKSKKVEPKEPNFERPSLLNDNLRFDADHHELFLVPKHPEMRIKGGNSLQFNPESVVMEFYFLQKHHLETENKDIWQGSAKMFLQFKELGKILDVQPGKGQQYNMSYQTKIDKQSVMGLYKIRDPLKDEKIEFFIQQTVKTTRTQSSKLFESNLTYDTFQIIQEIIRDGLYDLSGIRTMLDVMRMQELQTIKSDQNKLNKQKEQVKSFFNDS